MLRITAVSLKDFFEKLIFNAQCLYGIVLQRPLEDNDIVGLDSSTTQNAIHSVYLTLTHDEQKEVLKAILTSKSLFDSITERLDALEVNIIKWDKDTVNITNEALNEMVSRSTHETINYALKQFGLFLSKSSPALFQKLVLGLLNNGVDVEKAVAEAKKRYQASVRDANKLLDDINKFLPPDKQLPPADDQTGGEFNGDGFTNF